MSDPGEEQSEAPLAERADPTLEEQLRAWRVERRAALRRHALELVGLACVGAVGGTLVGSSATVAILWVGAMVMVAVTLYATATGQPPFMQAGSSRTIARTRVTTDVGPLIDVLAKPDRATHRAARAALSRLLPQLEAGDRNLLTKRHRETLNRLLPTANPRFAQAILAAYRLVGDEAAIPAIEALSARPGEQRSARDVRRAAQECLLVLRARLERERQAQILVRASVVQDGAGATLVRPAADAGSERTDLLVQPVEGGGEN